MCVQARKHPKWKAHARLSLLSFSAQARHVLIIKTVLIPLQVKVEQADALLELQMKLVNSEIIFEPGIDGEPGGLEEIMNTWLRMFFETATQMVPTYVFMCCV